MPVTGVRGRQILDDSVTRADINVTTSGSALITKVLVGAGLLISSSTGADSGTGDVTLTLGNSGVTAGTYGSATLIPVITVDQYGRITAVSTATVSGGGGSGTVTSIGLSLPSIFTVTGSPVTTTGTLTATLASQTANTFFAAPDGLAGAPTFRTILSTDIPNLDASKIVSGQLTVQRGGTGSSVLTGVLIGNGVSSFSGIVGTASQLFRRNASDTAYEFFTHTFASTTGATFSGQIISSRANNTGQGLGQIFLNGNLGNRIDWNGNGFAAPTLTTISEGTKLVLYPAISATTVDYAIGIDASVLWYSVPTTAASFRWYGATTLGATLTGAGALTLSSSLTATQVISTQANSATTGGGQIFLNGATGNRIDFASAGSAAPAFTTRSVGTKIVLSPTLSGVSLDYGIGVAPNILWVSTPPNAEFRVYNGPASIPFRVSGSTGTTIVSALSSGSGTFTGPITLFDASTTGITLYSGASAATNGMSFYYDGTNLTWQNFNLGTIANWVWNGLTASRTYTLPNASGTIPISVNGQLADASGNITISGGGGGTTLNGTGFVRMSGTTVSYITGTSSQFVKADGTLDSSTYLTANQSITLSGDATGTGTTSIAVTLANSGVTAGTYNNVTVNAKGLVTGGSNVSYLTTAVTSVGLSLPSIFSVSGSPITSTGTLTATLSSQSANTVFAAPDGSAGAPVFRTLVAADIPELTLEKLPDAWVKRAVRVATTSNITLSGTQTIDGIAVSVGDRVLVKDQSTPSQNGIYIVAAGSWTRSADADFPSELAGAMVAVDQGTINGGLTYDNDFRSTDTIGISSITWNRVIDTGYLIPVSQGGTGATSLTGILVGSGTSAITAIAGTANQLLRRNAGGTAYEFFTPTYLTANQSITLSGDLSGSGTTSIAATIANSAVTYAKIQNVTDNRILGRSAGSAGAVQEITIGSGLSLSAGVLTASAVSSQWITGSGFIYALSNVGIGSSGTPRGRFETQGPNGSPTPLSTAVTTDALIVSDAGNTGIVFGNGTLSAWVQARNLGANNTAHDFYINPLGGRVIVGSTSSDGVGNLQLNGTMSFRTSAAVTSPAIRFLPKNSLIASPAQGDMETDTNGLLYYSFSSLDRGVMQGSHYMCLSSSFTLNSSTTAQRIFNTATNGTMAVEAILYEFEMSLHVTNMSTGTNGALNISFTTGGGATLSSIQYRAIGLKGTVTSPTTPQMVTSQTAATTAVTQSNTSSAAHAFIKGIMRFSAAGTIRPTISLDVASAAVVQQNSYFKLTPLGGETYTSIGNIG